MALDFPTTNQLKNKFLEGIITEKQLFDQTKIGDEFTSVYLCSALVLEEYRGLGLITEMTIEAIEKIKSDYMIDSLFVWPFTEGGKNSAISIARKLNLPLEIKINRNEIQSNS